MKTIFSLLGDPSPFPPSLQVGKGGLMLRQLIICPFSLSPLPTSREGKVGWVACIFALLLGFSK
jgi:hypothetical protein